MKNLTRVLIFTTICIFCSSNLCFSQDSNNKKSGYDEYTVKGPNRDQLTPEFQTVEFSVPESRVITKLTQECIEGPCGFSYSTKENTPNNYNISYDLKNGGTVAVWTRKHTSSPVTYRIKVYWELVK